jgi:NAD(P) transhydrogenase
MPERFDLVVIGSGPAGEKAATQAAYFGKRVAVVERRATPGGIAVSDAGIPTKTLRETALYLTGFRHREVYGISLALDAKLKLERLTRRTAELRELMTEVVFENLRRMGVAFVHGAGRLGPDRTVIVAAPGGERVLEAEVVLIATGSRPHHPDGLPWGDPGVSDSERILTLDRLPRSMLVVGGGAVGCEYASIFTALGVEVVLAEAAPQLLAFADREMAEALAAIFVKDGMRVKLGACLDGLTRAGDRLVATFRGGGTEAVGHVLFAGGRIGNTEGLGLAEAGVDIDAKGRVRVDGHFRTTAPGIYAAGDVIGPPALASVSMEQGRVAACHAFAIPFKGEVDPLPPVGVYSVPELAQVGLTEDAARATGVAVETGRCPFAKNTRARIAGTTDGLVKLVFRRDDRVLLGVHIVGDIAAELIHVGQIATAEARPIDWFIHHTFNVPTYTEAYKYAAYDGLQRVAKVGGGSSGASASS